MPITIDEESARQIGTALVYSALQYVQDPKHMEDFRAWELKTYGDSRAEKADWYKRRRAAHDG